MVFAGKSDGPWTCQMQEADATYAVAKMLYLYDPVTG